MASIFLIVKNCKGASGQGGMTCKYISLFHDGDSFKLGTPAPAFETFEMAESFRKKHDEHDFYHVIGMDVLGVDNG